MEYYLAMKKKEILPFVTAWMNLEIIMLSEISQSKKKKCLNSFNKLFWAADEKIFLSKELKVLVINHILKSLITFFGNRGKVISSILQRGKKA